MTGSGPARDVVPLRWQATRAWFLISLQTFGGPAGQIAVMQRTLVDETRWIGERRFLHALSYCMLLPGPGGAAAGDLHRLAAQRVGWAASIAGVLFVLPGAVAMLALSWVYVAHGDTTLVTGLFLGLAPAVVAIVVQAVVAVGRRALHRPALVVLAVAAFLVLAAARACRSRSWCSAPGWSAGCSPRCARTSPERASDAATGEAAPLVPDDALHHAAPSARRNVGDPGVGAGRSGWPGRRWRSPSPAGADRSSSTRGSSSAAWPW